MRSQHGYLAVHDTAQRAADVLAVLRAGAPEQREQVIAVLRARGEPEPIEITEADMTEVRQAALELLEVFTAASTAEAAERLSRLLAGHARPPRLTTHEGQAGWHVHVDSRDDAPWGEWFLTSSCLALALLLAERQAPPAGICASPSCGKPFVNTGRGSARHYCGPSCGTRERVAAHRARSGRADRDHGGDFLLQAQVVEALVQVGAGAGGGSGRGGDGCRAGPGRT
ncbi:MAG: CGNR zinc finger domain-containing protein [Streptosporangiaceae bacterium]